VDRQWWYGAKLAAVILTALAAACLVRMAVP